MFLGMECDSGNAWSFVGKVIEMCSIYQSLGVLLQCDRTKDRLDLFECTESRMRTSLFTVGIKEPV